MSLRLGTDTGSMTNYLMSGTNGEPTPVVGMGATILMWSDRHAATIIKATPTQVHVLQDAAKRVDKNGVSETQEYSYSLDPHGKVWVFRKTKRGWRETGGGSFLRIGERDEYHDYSF